LEGFFHLVLELFKPLLNGVSCLHILFERDELSFSRVHALDGLSVNNFELNDVIEAGLKMLLDNS